MSVPKKDKAALLRSLEASRRQISGDLGEVGSKLNVPQRFRDSVSQNTLKWIGGGVAAGALLAILSPIRFRKKKEKAEQVKRGLIGTAFFGLLGLMGKQILLSALPSVQKVAQEGFQQWYATRFGGGPGTEMPPELNIED